MLILKFSPDVNELDLIKLIVSTSTVFIQIPNFNFSSTTLGNVKSFRVLPNGC